MKKREAGVRLHPGHPGRIAGASDSHAASTSHSLSVSIIQEELGISKKKSVEITPLHVEKPEAYNQQAWHGSPYVFDAFDLGAIGTGEGSQVHGWGLCFAKNRQISESYRELLSEPDVFKFGGKTYHEGLDFVVRDENDVEASDAVTLAFRRLRRFDGDKEKALALLNDELEDESRFEVEATDEDEADGHFENQKILNEAKRILLKNSRIEKGNKGVLFAVDVPEDDVMPFAMRASRASSMKAGAMASALSSSTTRRSPSSSVSTRRQMVAGA